LATKLVQVVTDQRYWLTPGPTIGPIFNGFEKVFQLATELLQVVIDQRNSLAPQGPRRTNSQIIGPTGSLDKLLDQF
jgi:hypothetical protein